MRDPGVGLVDAAATGVHGGGEMPSEVGELFTKMVDGGADRLGDADPCPLVGAGEPSWASTDTGRRGQVLDESIELGFGLGGAFDVVVGGRLLDILLEVGDALPVHAHRPLV